MAKLRTRKHKVVLARSAGGDAGITVILVILGAFMFLPMVYAIMQSLKPLDELWMYPPRFYVMSPTLKNYKDLEGEALKDAVKNSEWLQGSMTFTTPASGRVIVCLQNNLAYDANNPANCAFYLDDIEIFELR